MGYHARRFSTRLARTPTLPGATVGDTLNSHLVVLNISKMYIDQMVDHSNCTHTGFVARLIYIYNYIYIDLLSLLKLFLNRLVEMKTYPGKTYL